MELNMKIDLVDAFRRSSAVADSKIADLGIEIQKQIEEKKRIEMRLEEASREPGKKTCNASLCSIFFIAIICISMLKSCFKYSVF